MSATVRKRVRFRGRAFVGASVRVHSVGIGRVAFRTVLGVFAMLIGVLRRLLARRLRVVLLHLCQPVSCQKGNIQTAVSLIVKPLDIRDYCIGKFPFPSPEVCLALCFDLRQQDFADVPHNQQVKAIHGRGRNVCLHRNIFILRRVTSDLGSFQPTAGASFGVSVL